MNLQYVESIVKQPSRMHKNHGFFFQGTDLNSGKILIISHEFPPIGGGAGRNLLVFCEELQKRGYRFEVVTQKPNIPTTDHSFTIHYVNGYRRKTLETSFLSMIVFSIKSLLFVFFRTRGFSLIFSNMAIPAGLTGALVSKCFNVPHMIWHHGSDVHGGREYGASLLQRVILRAVWRCSDVNCFVSDGLRKAANYQNKHVKTQILPIGVKPDLQFRFQSDKKPCFLFLGRMEPVKNPLALIEALNLLRKNIERMPQIRMIGDGSLFAKVNQKIKSYCFDEFISLETCVTHEEALSIIGNAYSLVIPSVIEGFNTTIIEAALLGVPSIGSNVCGINDFITHKSTGLLCDKGSIESLAESINYLYNHVSVRNEMGENARKKALQFTPENSVDKFEHILSHLFTIVKSDSKAQIKET
jgi:glycosyltransferase involved in cell wall biosynthesis